MRTIRSLTAMQRQARAWKRAGTPIGFVPTMGCLHAGHLALVARARRAVGPHGRLVVSIYVNPTQFGAGEDFDQYPRVLAADRRLCRAAGVDVVFAPTDAAMYPRPGAPGGAFSTYVVEEQLSRPLEGAARPTHFRGVTTIVAKLFNLVLPDVAVFGAKDYQQATVVRRMARDLNFPLRIVVAPTVREPDGLALSSRNRYLSPPQRAQAIVLWQTIARAQAAVRQARRPLPVSRLTAQLRQGLSEAAEAQVDYLEFFDPTTLAPVFTVKRGVHLALAVRFGKTRLIDNARL